MMPPSDASVQVLCSAALDPCSAAEDRPAAVDSTAASREPTVEDRSAAASQEPAAEDRPAATAREPEIEDRLAATAREPEIEDRLAAAAQEPCGEPYCVLILSDIELPLDEVPFPRVTSTDVSLPESDAMDA